MVLLCNTGGENMSFIKRIILFTLTTAVIAFPLLASGQEEIENASPRYFVSILPQAYLLERIGGEKIEVSVMVPPGKSPATYEPTPRQVMELGEAQAFFTLGVPFEANFLPSLKSTLPDLPLVDSASGIKRRHLESHHHEEENHGEAEQQEDHHEEGTLDPHVWLSPILAKTIAQNMAETLINKDPANKDVYESNLNTLLADLDALDKELTELLAPIKGETLFVYHPSFGYFADRYGLEQEAIELGGKEPSPADLEKVIEEAREDGVHVVLVQPEFSLSSAQAVAKAIDGAVIPVETLNGDYLKNLKDLAQHLRESLE
jgi:zinc transport system substrate-binding protein